MTPAATHRLFYASAALIVFVIEAAIALFLNDDLIRPYGGDVLAVALVYLALRAATPLRLGSALTSALTLAVAIELAQLVHILDLVGLAGNRLARTVFGGVFDLRDLVAYAVGGVVVIVGERLRER